MGADNSKATSVVNEPVDLVPPSKKDISRMDRAIRLKLHGGAHYNMKVVLSGVKNECLCNIFPIIIVINLIGMRGSGKTCLWKRFQGQPFTAKVRMPMVFARMHYKRYLYIYMLSIALLLRFK